MSGMTIKEWGEENGSYGACESCGRKTWIEFGCAKLCMSCEHQSAEEPPEPDAEPDTLANLGLSEADFR
jgi:hypothetical protein